MFYTLVSEVTPILSAIFCSLEGSWYIPTYEIMHRCERQEARMDEVFLEAFYHAIFTGYNFQVGTSISSSKGHSIMPPSWQLPDGTECESGSLGDAPLPRLL